jgi:hypothetical protein
MSKLKNNLRAERISATCNRCGGERGRWSYQADEWINCGKCLGHGIVVVSVRYIPDTKEPFLKAKD